MDGSMKLRRFATVVALACSLSIAGAPAHATVGAAAPSGAQQRLSSSALAVTAAALAVPAAKKRPRATVAATYAPTDAGQVGLVVTSNAKQVQVRYRTVKNKSRTLNRKIKAGTIAVNLPAGSKKIRVRAKATSKLRASAWRSAKPAVSPPAPVTPVTWRSLAQSTSRTCGIDAQSRAVCWSGGLVASGQAVRSRALVAATELPAMAGALAGRSVARIAVGNNHTCALDSQGLAYCWGSNIHGQLGDGLGAYTSPGSAQPVAVDASGALAGRTLVEIAVGEYHTCAIDSEGLAYCWGFNEGGALGIGEFGGLSYGDRLTPTPVVSSGALLGRRLVRLALGLYHSCAVDTEGLAFCWGGDMYGQVGVGKEGTMVGGTNFDEPVAVVATGALAGKRLSSIAAGGHTTCAVDDTGAAYCWGWNGQGQLGRGASSSTPGPLSPSRSLPAPEPWRASASASSTPAPSRPTVACSAGAAATTAPWARGGRRTSTDPPRSTSAATWPAGCPRRCRPVATGRCWSTPPASGTRLDPGRPSPGRRRPRPWCSG